MSAVVHHHFTHHPIQNHLTNQSLSAASRPLSVSVPRFALCTDRRMHHVSISIDSSIHPSIDRSICLSIYLSI